VEDLEIYAKIGANINDLFLAVAGKVARLPTESSPTQFDEITERNCC
jgi:hypothetical protein